MSPQDFLNRWQSESPEAIADALKTHLNTLVEVSDTDHLAWAEVAEQLGQFALAFREAQLAVRDQPNNPLAAKKLGLMLLERGQAEKAARQLENALKHLPGDQDVVSALGHVYAESGLESSHSSLQAQTGQTLTPAPKVATPPPPSESGVSEAAAIRFWMAFAGREDVHARQWASRDGRSGYTPVHQPLTPRQIRGHLAGAETLGVYCLRLDGTAPFLALDLDITKAALQEALTSPERALRLREALQQSTQLIYQTLQDCGLPALIENSGHKGRHLWVIFDQPVPGEIAHLAGTLLARRIVPHLPPDLHLEVFPKQGGLDDTRKGLGNLIKLPLGIHQKSGRRSIFLTPEGEMVKAWDRHLSEVPRISPEALYRVIENLKRENLPELPDKPLKKAVAQQAAPAQVLRQWTEADFEHDPQIRHLFAQCAVLRKLRRQVETHRQLSNDEQLVMLHSLGHTTQGVMAVNYLFARCANIPPERFLSSPLQGNPVSCPKIRKRIPHISAQVRCNCDFSRYSEQYPNPVLHLRTLPAESSSPAPESLETQARRYATLARRIGELEQEQQQLALVLREALKALPEPVLQLNEGRYSLRQYEETEILHWEPAHGT